MARILAPLALLAAAPVLAQPAPAAPAAPVLNETQAGALRCAVGFAIVTQLQKSGSPAGAAYPALGDRGREYFVRVAAQLMDQTGADRSTVTALINAEVARLSAAEGEIAAQMPGCMVQLEAAGL